MRCLHANAFQELKIDTAFTSVFNVCHKRLCSAWSTSSSRSQGVLMALDSLRGNFIINGLSSVMYSVKAATHLSMFSSGSVKNIRERFNWKGTTKTFPFNRVRWGQKREVRACGNADRDPTQADSPSMHCCSQCDVRWRNWTVTEVAQNQIPA